MCYVIQIKRRATERVRLHRQPLIQKQNEIKKKIYIYFSA